MFEGLPVVGGLLFVHWVVRIKWQMAEKDRRNALELARHVVSIAPARRNGVGWVSSLAQPGLLLLLSCILGCDAAQSLPMHRKPSTSRHREHLGLDAAGRLLARVWPDVGGNVRQGAGAAGCARQARRVCHPNGRQGWAGQGASGGLDGGCRAPAGRWHLGTRFHCQVPCGIFTDDLRYKMLLEDATTIRKSVVQMQELHKAGTLQDIHQMTRWIKTKEDHAGGVMHTVADYFMAQKLKKDLLSKEEYLEVLAMLHAVMVAAMKTKQSSELAAVDALDAALKALEPLYSSK